MLNANTVMIPVWAAALLFYSARAPRARQSPTPSLPARSQALHVLGKYWAAFLSRRHGGRLLRRRRARNASGVRLRPISWRPARRSFSPPHVWWMPTAVAPASFSSPRAWPSHAVQRRIGEVGELFCGRRWPTSSALRSSSPRCARAAPLWPIRSGRPMTTASRLDLVAACRSCCRRWLIWPFRTGSPPPWTSPNWALLPIVLYGSRALLIDDGALTARAGLATLAVTLAILIASPIIACVS